MKIDIDRHPLKTLEFMAERIGARSYRLVSYQERTSNYGTIFRERETFLVDAKNIVKEGLAIIDAAAHQGMDVVVDSRLVTTRGETRHLGLIDFALPADHLTKGLVWGLNSLEKSMQIGRHSIDTYNSGRSYHGYLTDASFTDEELKNFFADLLLTLPVGPNGDQPVVDSRWIGHSLKKGSAGLRLSKTASRYLQYPERVRNTGPRL